MSRDYIFVYGLFRDQANRLLGDSTFCGKSSVSGKIYKVNEFYPGFVCGDGVVWGDVYLFDSKLLKDMDEYEGDEYDRVKIKSGDWYLR
jgi:gamma-glutamylcyclotransferase (GGCT)/AIG2-like uncharacterized protein YtfP